MEPSYQQRLDLIEELSTTRYAAEPIWMFDRALLLAQAGNYRDAGVTFGELRKGKRFVEVPIERARWLSLPDSPTRALQARIRIVGVHADGLGWARVEDPKGFVDPIPFSPMAFLRAGGGVAQDTIRLVNIKLAPAGFFVEPISPSRDGGT
jgi:hypothetical protein